VELRGQLQVVVLRARAGAKLLEVEPHHTARLAARMQRSVLNAHDGRFFFGFDQLLEGGCHRRLGIWPQG
jgi:hypothetical protein